MTVPAIALASVDLILVLLVRRWSREGENEDTPKVSGDNAVTASVDERNPATPALDPPDKFETPTDPKHDTPPSRDMLEQWADRVRRIKRDPPNWDRAKAEVDKLVGELVAWIGEDQGRFREVTSLVGGEKEMAVWAPALLAIARCKVPDKRGYLLGLIEFNQDPDKCKMAGMMALEGDGNWGLFSLSGAGQHVRRRALVESDRRLGHAALR